MRPDLLYSQAAIDWAVGNFPSFQKKLDEWINTKVRIGIEELEAHIPNNLLIAGSEEPLPLAFSAEAGAYINSIRSALDMLATALVERHGLPIKPDDIYFPIKKSEDAFKEDKIVKALPDAERKIVESLKPYCGGNELLWALHRLDILRKHRRLLTADLTPTKLKISGYGVHKNFTAVSTGYVSSGDKIILGLLTKGTPPPDVKLVAHITIHEVDLVNKKSVVGVLNQFAEHVTKIIKMFDVE